MTPSFIKSVGRLFLQTIALRTYDMSVRHPKPKEGTQPQRSENLLQHNFFHSSAEKVFLSLIHFSPI